MVDILSVIPSNTYTKPSILVCDFALQLCSGPTSVIHGPFRSQFFAFPVFITCGVVILGWLKAGSKSGILPPHRSLAGQSSRAVCDVCLLQKWGLPGFLLPCDSEISFCVLLHPHFVAFCYLFGWAHTATMTSCTPINVLKLKKNTKFRLTLGDDKEGAPIVT